MANPSTQSRKRAAPGTSAPIYDNISNTDFIAQMPYMPPMPPNHLGALGGRTDQQQQQPPVVPNANTQLILSQRGRGNAGAMVNRSNNQNSNSGSGTAQGTNPGTWNSHTEAAATNENENELDALRDSAMRIAKAKAGRKQIPPFVQKLAQFVNDPKCDDVIRWSESGKSFLVLDEDAFSKNLIPDLFKHNNYASFVRQLNMYGFHKVVALSDGSMKTAEQRAKPILEYTNPYFQRDQKDLLWLIQKPKSNSKKKPTKKEKDSDDDNSSDDGKGYDEVGPDRVNPYPNLIENGPSRSRQGNPTQQGAGAQGPQTQDLSNILQQLESIKQHQALISTAIARIRKDHQALYEQAVAFQSLHDRHENSINHILNFLATVYDKTLGGHLPAPFANVYNAVGTPSVSPPVGNVGPVVGTPRGLLKRTPLLLENGPGNPYQAQAMRATRTDLGNAFPKQSFSNAQIYGSDAAIQELKSSPKSANLQSPVSTLDTPVTVSDSTYVPNKAQFPGTPVTPGATSLSPRSRQQSVLQDMRPALNNFNAHVSDAGDQLKDLQSFQKEHEANIGDLERMLHGYISKSGSNAPSPTLNFLNVKSASNAPSPSMHYLSTPTTTASMTTIPLAPTPPATFMPDDLIGGENLFLDQNMGTPDMNSIDWNALAGDLGNDNPLSNFDLSSFPLTTEDPNQNKITSAASSPETVDEDGRETKKQRRA